MKKFRRKIANALGAILALILSGSLNGCANRDPTMSGVMTVQEAGAIVALDREFRAKQ